MKGHPSLVRWSRLAAGVALAFAFALATALTAQARERPNILVIFGDDVGVTNISAYSGGLMGYETPNIDRIAKEGVSRSSGWPARGLALRFEVTREVS